MDKLQKMATWLWLYKERIIFVVMVIVLVQRVWLVLNPNQIEREYEPPLSPPGDTLPAQGAPPDPPPTPTIYTSGSYKDLNKKNPFWVHAGTETNTTVEDKPSVTLMSIMSGSSPRARITDSRGSRSFYSVNDTVDGYTIEEIDTEAQTVTIVNEETGVRYTLEK